MALVEKYQDRPLTDRAFELAWTHSQVVLRQINASEADAQLYARLASSVIFSNPSFVPTHRLSSGIAEASRRFGVIPFREICPLYYCKYRTLRILNLARQMVQAHAYWRLKGLMVDLVIWNEDFGGYRQALQNELLSLISPGIIT